jgi:glycosyltransferase involved in cell wall biosynthesis
VRIVAPIDDPQPPGPGFAERAGAVFVASFEHEPNADAIRWYLEQIHPRVLSSAPSFALTVIGTDAPAWLLAWRAPGVRVVGAAPDLGPHFARARLSVAPLRYGAGVKGKINTSHSFGVPVVATSVAAEGMHLVHGESVWIADDPDAFADGVLRVHEDEELWARLAAGGRANLETHFSTARARAELERLLTQTPSH